MSDWKEKLKQRTDVSHAKRRLPGGMWSSAALLMQKDNIRVSERQILDAVHEDPVFYACLSLIASKVADTDVYTVNSSGEKDLNHPVNDVIQNPNPFHTKFTFFWLLTVYLLSTGSCYIYVQEDGTLLPLSNRQITHKGGKNYVIKLWNTDRREGKLGENLAKVRLPDVREPYLTGAGYGSAIGGELDISKAAREHESAVLHNNARPDMFINFEGVNDDEIKRVQQAWSQKHRGPEGSGQVAFMNAANLSVETLNTSFSDLGLIDLREYSSDVKRRTFGIPPELLGQVENSNRATIESAFYLFSKTVLEPKLNLILSALNTALIPILTNDNVKLECEDVVPEDKDRKMEAMDKFPQAFTVNEARVTAGFEPIEGGDIPLEQGAEEFLPEEKSNPVRKEPLRRKLKDEVPALNSGIPEELHLSDLHRDLIKQENRCE